MSTTSAVPSNAPSVTCEYRVAVKVGDDYYTVDSIISLPPGATSAEIQEAVATRDAIQAAQSPGVNQLVAAIKDAAGEPASQDQRNYIYRLLRDINWKDEHFSALLAERGLANETLTKRQASKIIDHLKEIKAGTIENPVVMTDSAGMTY